MRRFPNFFPIFLVFPIFFNSLQFFLRCFALFSYIGTIFLGLPFPLFPFCGFYTSTLLLLLLLMLSLLWSCFDDSLTENASALWANLGPNFPAGEDLLMDFQQKNQRYVLFPANSKFHTISHNFQQFHTISHNFSSFDSVSATLKQIHHSTIFIWTLFVFGVVVLLFADNLRSFSTRNTCETIKFYQIESSQEIFSVSAEIQSKMH